MTRHDTLDLGRWCILRMASAATLSVCSYLTTEGFEVWTPVARKHGRMPGTRARFDRPAALLPSYAFAGVQRVEDLQSLAVLPTTDCPRFTIFRHNGGIPLIADDELGGLRDEETRIRRVFDKFLRRDAKAPVFEPGSIVTTPEAGFEGLLGVVESSRGQYTLVNFPGFARPIKVASLLLLPDKAIEQQALNAKAA
jgi:hypothetical protein